MDVRVRCGGCWVDERSNPGVERPVETGYAPPNALRLGACLEAAHGDGAWVDVDAVVAVARRPLRRRPQAKARAQQPHTEATPLAAANHPTPWQRPKRAAAPGARVLENKCDRMDGMPAAAGQISCRRASRPRLLKMRRHAAVQATQQHPNQRPQPTRACSIDRSMGLEIKANRSIDRSKACRLRPTWFFDSNPGACPVRWLALQLHQLSLSPLTFDKRRPAALPFPHTLV